MAKKYVVAFLIAVLMFATTRLWTTEKSSTLTFANIYGDAVVNKIPGEPFKVSITFKNIGATEGSWIVNIALEGDLRSKAGIPKALHLNPGETTT